MRFFHHFTNDPVSLSIKEKLVAVLCCFMAIFIAAFVTQRFVNDLVYPVLVASMGASAVILFIIPSSPLAQPWPFAGGQICSALIGIACAHSIPETVIAAACAVGGSVLVMLLLRCLHPPGAATALAPVLSGPALTSLGYHFVLMPVAINVMVMLFMSLLINRWILKRDYPSYCPPKKIETDSALISETLLQNINEDDLIDILIKNHTFVDVTPAEIRKLFFQAEKFRFEQLHEIATCSDIMTREVVTAEYGTHVEEAWAIMHQQKLQAMPVIDKAQRVIGIVSWSNFFKFLNLSPYDSLQDNFRAFIRRTADINTDKPESVGHLMSKPVIVLSEDAHIAELIPLMSMSGIRQIPIINKEKRLVGMVYQSQLIAALYRLMLTHGAKIKPDHN